MGNEEKINYLLNFLIKKDGKIIILREILQNIDKTDIYRKLSYLNSLPEIDKFINTII